MTTGTLPTYNHNNHLHDMTTENNPLQKFRISEIVTDCFNKFAVGDHKGKFKPHPQTFTTILSDSEIITELKNVF